MATTYSTTGITHAGTPVAAFLRRYARGRLRQMMAHEAGTRAGDEDALHDLRVAARRLRSGLRLARGLFPDRRTERRLERAVRDLASPLGRARDLDVVLRNLASYRDKAPAADQPAIGLLVASIEGARAAEHEQMKVRLRAFGRRRRLAAFEASIATLRAGRARMGGRQRTAARPDSPAPFGIAPDTPTEEAARRLLPRLLDQLLAGAAAAADSGAINEHHDLRIDAKRLRYAMETFAFLFPSELRDLIPPIRLIQDILGRVHDADVSIPMFDRYLEQHGEGSAAILRLIGAIRERRRLLFAEFQGAWLELERVGFRSRFLAAVAPGTSPPGIDASTGRP